MNESGFRAKVIFLYIYIWMIILLFSESVCLPSRSLAHACGARLMECGEWTLRQAQGPLTTEYMC